MATITDEVITVEGNKCISFKQKYEINKDSIVEISITMRSAGLIKSKIYAGIHCYKEDGGEILCEDIYRKESLLIISKSNDMKSFTLNKKPETWNNPTDKNVDYLKLIGIYYDGNIDHLPDYVIRNRPAYQNYTNNVITLNEELPKEIYDKIIPNKTKVMNHFCSNTYDYSIASYVEVDNEKWTTFSATYNGFNELREGYVDVDIKGKYRPGTKTISPLILANYGQNTDAKLEIKNAKITLKDKLDIIS